MGCPDAIKGHLAGLRDVHSVAFNVDTRFFSMQCENFSKARLQAELDIVSRKEQRTFTVDEYRELIL